MSQGKFLVPLPQKGIFAGIVCTVTAYSINSLRAKPADEL